KVCLFRCRPSPPACRVRSAGCLPPITHSTRSSPIRCMPALTPTEKLASNVTSMNQGAVRKRIRHLPMEQWAVLIQDHYPGFIDWATFQANQARLDSNTRPKPHQSGGAVREGSALLQGIATCGHCGRRLMTHYRGRNSTPGYHCAGKDLVNGRGVYCLNIGGLAIEQV